MCSGSLLASRGRICGAKVPLRLPASKASTVLPRFTSTAPLHGAVSPVWRPPSTLHFPASPPVAAVESGDVTCLTGRLAGFTRSVAVALAKGSAPACEQWPTFSQSEHKADPVPSSGIIWDRRDCSPKLVFVGLVPGPMAQCPMLTVQRGA